MNASRRAETLRLLLLLPVLSLLAAAPGGCAAPGEPGAAFDGVAVPDAPKIPPEMRTAASDLDSFAWFQDFPEDTARAAAARPGAVAGRFAFAANVGIPLVTPEAYPDADEVSLFEWESTRYATNGTYTTTWTTLSKILTQRGLEDNRTFSFSNDDFYGSTTVLVARIRTPGVPPRDVDLAANLAEAIDTGSLASNIHDPNDKTFTLALPGLQVGDAVELVMRRTAKRPRCEGVYSDYLTFESDHPILFQGARIEGPASMPLRSRAFRDAGPVTLAHAAVTNEAEGTIVEAWVADETPRFFAEPDMPPAYDCTARLLLSTAPDWESLSRWYARLCAPHLAATNDAMRAKVDELLRTALSAPPAAGPAEGADDGGASSPSEPQDRAPRDRAPRADESDPAEWANAVFVGYEFLSSLESENPGPLALDPDEALKRRLGEFGVGWPAGSFVRIFPECHAFAVCNSRSNLDILSRALGDASPEPRVLEIDRETPIRPWWFFGGDGPEAVSRRKLAPGATRISSGGRIPRMPRIRSRPWSRKSFAPTPCCAGSAGRRRRSARKSSGCACPASRPGGPNGPCATMRAQSRRRRPTTRTPGGTP